MRVLIDTNIFISREDYSIIPQNIQELLIVLQKLNARVVIHPFSVAEIERDRNRERREIVLSKIKTYITLEKPPHMDRDPDFIRAVGAPRDENERVDVNLLYCVYRDAADFLVSEDKNLRKKAEKVRVANRVLSVDECLSHCEKYLEDKNLILPPAIRLVPAHNLDPKDPIFESLRSEYPDFDIWWKKVSREGRNAWVYEKQDARLGAILILKTEDEAIASTPPLPRKKRTKICTIKVTEMGNKIGELFVKTAIQYATRNDCFEVYLTHFTKAEDELVQLISEFGFLARAKKSNGEDVLLKELIPSEDVKSPVEISTRFYPSFYDGKSVHKFIIPIRPEYHDRLFTDYARRQTLLSEHEGRLVIEGNTIKKAYLCHANVRWMSPGDIVLFYRSIDEQCLTSIGVVESVHNSSDADKIAGYVAKRTVYTGQEIKEMARKSLKVIMFMWHFYLPKPLSLTYLQQNHLLSMVPMTIVRIPHDKYLQIRRASGLDERFAFDSTEIRRENS